MFIIVILSWLIKKKKGYINTKSLDLKFIVYMHSKFVVNSATNSNSPLKYPSTNLCLRKLGCLIVYALNYPVILSFELVYLIWFLFVCLFVWCSQLNLLLLLFQAIDCYIHFISMSSKPHNKWIFYIFNEEDQWLLFNS